MTAASTMKIVDNKHECSYLAPAEDVFADGTTCATFTRDFMTIIANQPPNHSQGLHDTILNAVTARASPEIRRGRRRSSGADCPIWCWSVEGIAGYQWVVRNLSAKNGAILCLILAEHLIV